MSWFGSNSREQKEASRMQELAQKAKIEEQKVLQKAQQVQWMRSQTTADFIELFNSLEVQVKSVTQDSSELGDQNKYSYRSAIDAWAQIRRTFFEIDKVLLNESQLISLYELLSDRIPSTISNFQTRAITNGIHGAWYYYDCKETFSQAFDLLVSILNSQIGLVRSTEPNLEVINNNVFPAYDITHSNIAEPLARIRKLWTQASEKNNTVENEYFLEQVVSSYLPEAYRLYSTFQLAPEELQQSAAKIFIEQLELIERHLVHILRTYMEQNLVAMQNHMDFLKQKTLDSAKKHELLEITTT